MNISRPIAAPVDPVTHNRNIFVDALMNAGAISSKAISNFVATANATTKGIDVSFQITDKTGMASVSLLRAAVMDIKQASILQTWTASESTFTWSDTDQALQAIGGAYYYLKLEPVNVVSGIEVQVGPQFILLNPSLLPPLALDAISASHGAASNGVVLVTINATRPEVGNSLKIYVQNYLGNPASVAIAQSTTTPLQFNMQATGETVTFTAISVSSGGAEAPSGPTCTLTLNGSATVPAKIQDVTVAQISTGNQISWPASLEAGITQYDLYRGQRGSGFGSATLLISIAASGAGTEIYLDTAGLTGDFEYYVIAVSGSGNSPASDAANPIILFSSSQLPPNTPANYIGGAVVDSVDGGSSATIRIYGTGGVGTGWTKTVGYGTVTRPAGSITGLAYSTTYYVLYNVAGGVYLASTTYAGTLPDGYEWVGALNTAPSGGGGATTPTATANIDGSGHVVGLTPVQPGYGMLSASVSFSGPGSGATATANVVSGRVISYTVTNQGGGYTIAPTVTVTPSGSYAGGGGGTNNSGARYVIASIQ